MHEGKQRTAVAPSVQQSSRRRTVVVRQLLQMCPWMCRDAVTTFIYKVTVQFHWPRSERCFIGIRIRSTPRAEAMPHDAPLLRLTHDDVLEALDPDAELRVTPKRYVT